MAYSSPLERTLIGLTLGLNVDDDLAELECIRCGEVAPGRMHFHLPWSGDPFDIGWRFYCDRCWRKVRNGAIFVIIFGVITIGGLAGFIRVLTWLA